MKNEIINKNLAFLCHPYHRGGVTRWMVDGAFEASKNGYNVYFVTVKPKYPFYSAAGQPLLIDLLKENPSVTTIANEVGFEFEFGTPQFKSWTYSKAILKSVPPGTPIIVSDDPSVWKAATEVSIRNPMIAVLHSDDLAYFDLALKHLKAVNTFVAVSHRIAKACKTIPMLSHLQVPVIPCGIPFVETETSPSKKNEKLSLIWTGRIEEKQKRVSDLIKIVLKLKETNTEFHLNIIGNGPEFEWMKAEIQEKNIKDAITMHGWQNSKAILKILKQSDLLVLPSNYEGMPVSMMEALSCGCGVVASRVSGVEDYENKPISNDCFWVYSIGDIDQAVDSIIKAMGTPVENRKKAALNFAKQEFSINSCMQKYYRVIDRNIETFVVNDIKGGRLSVYSCMKSYILSTLRYVKMKFKN